MKDFLALLGEAMKNTGTTLRLCLLILVAAMAYLLVRKG